MAKGYVIIVTGIMGGIVALTTSFLGVTGTIIGSVIAAMVMEISSQYIKEPLENKDFKIFEERIIFLIPLIVIILIELIYLLNIVGVTDLFWFLEGKTNDNLFRVIGFSLIVLAIYQILQRKRSKWEYGIVLGILGIFIFIWGFVENEIPIVDSFDSIFIDFNFYLTFFILVVLSLITLKILYDSLNVYVNREKLGSIKNKKKNIQAENENVEHKQILTSKTTSNISKKEEKILRECIIRKYDDEK